MKISVVTPVYNSEKYLDRLLKSIISQTYENYEIILVDDGSIDNSLKIIKQYQKKDKRIKCTSIENSGPGAARKKGFELSTGDLIFFVDSDDYIPNDEAFGKIAQIYEREHFDILFFNLIRKANNKERIANAFFSNKIKEGKKTSKYLYNHVVVPALWYKIFVRKKMKIEYFCDSRNYEDFYATYLYLNECENFYYTKEILYYANRDNENSISKTIDTKKIANTVELLKITYEKVKPEYKFIISKTMATFYIDTRRMIDISNDKIEEKRKQINEIKKLKKYFNIAKLIKMKITIRQYIKYIYYEMIDKKSFKKEK